VLHVVKLSPGHSELHRIKVPGPGMNKWASGGNVLLYPVLGGRRRGSWLCEGRELARSRWKPSVVGSTLDSLIESVALSVHSYVGDGVDQASVLHIHQQSISTEKVSTNEGHVYIGRYNVPAETLTPKTQLHIPDAISADGAAVSSFHGGAVTTG